MTKALAPYGACILVRKTSGVHQMETSHPQYVGPTSGFINLNGCFLATCESFSALPTSKYSLKGRDRVSYRRRQWQPTPILLPGKSHGQRSLVVCSPCELDTIEQLHFHFYELKKEKAKEQSFPKSPRKDIANPLTP